MECQGDTKKLFKVFDASRRKRSRKRRNGRDGTSHSPATDGSTSQGCRAKDGRPASAVASLQDVSTTQLTEIASDIALHKRQGLSLALKGARASTPRCNSPTLCGSKKRDEALDIVSRFDQDSMVYAFLEDAIKRDKKKRHSRRQADEIQESPDRDASRGRRHHHKHRHRDDSPREHSLHKETSLPVNQITETIVETFAKLCAQITESRFVDKAVPRTISNKSLQCLVDDLDQRPVKLRSRENSRENVSPASRIRSNVTVNHSDRPREKYTKDLAKYTSKNDLRPRGREHEYAPLETRTRSRIDVNKQPSRLRELPEYGYRERDYDRDGKHYEGDKKRIEQKTSRSFDIDRERYVDNGCRRTYRSDDKYDYPRHKRFEERDRKFDDKRYDKFYEDRPHLEGRDRGFVKEERSKRILECDRNSVVSRDDDYRERLSERERDSGLSVADGNSTVSGRSNYLRFVKQEIAQQRESMDKMMKLWKDLMKCFRGISQPQDQNLKTANETAAQARDSAASQLRLWRECMRRYETVARDVGDTDTRLMEEINKQRSEMAEMATMWQECLQRYREMSTDFNNLKQKLERPESPQRLPVPAPAAVYADGEGAPPPSAPYRVPAGFVPPPPPVYVNCGSPLRGRASAPPPWSWWDGHGQPPRPRRQSLESRGSRDRRRRSRSRPKERRKDKDDGRYKEKSSKSSAVRSEQRSRKR